MRKMSLLLCALLWAGSVSPASAAPELTKGLILRYSFDQNKGSTVIDDSGQGHTGAVNGAAFTTQGRFGGAYYFNGINNHILAGNLGYQEKGSISFWMKPQTVENWRNPFSTDYAGWDDCIRFEESSDGKFIGNGLGLGNGGYFTTALAPNLWYHVVYVWDKYYTYGYLNGELKFKIPYPDPNSMVHPNLPLTAGQYLAETLNLKNVAIGNGYSTEPQRYWKGWIDEVRVYNRPLTSEEAQALAVGEGNQPAPTVGSDGLVLHLPLDAAPVNGLVYDQSGQGHNGTVNGAAFTSQGQIGGAYYFNGVSNHILVGNLGYQEKGVVSFWMKPEAVENWRNPFSTNYAGWDDCLRFEEGSDGTFVGSGLGLGTGVYTTPQAPLSANRWYHVAFAWDKSYIYGYLNGELKFKNPYPNPNAPVHPDLPLTAGQYLAQTLNFRNVAIGNGYSTDPQRYWKGWIDDVRVYNRVLSDYEIRALHNAVSLGMVYQNFEANNGTPPPWNNPGAGPEYGWALNGATVELSTTERYGGSRSWKIQSTGNYGGTTVTSRIQTYNLNTEPGRHDRLTFWVKNLSTDQQAHDVRVRFFDKGNYRDMGNWWDGFEVNTTKKATYNAWTQLTVLFTQLPSGFDLTHLDKINFVNEFPGTYYLDNIQIESQDRTYQAFEPWSCPSGDPYACGWPWDGGTIALSSTRKEGAQSWRLDLTKYWSGTGIKSQEKRCQPADTCSYQSEWVVDLSPRHLIPAQFDRLSFWVYSLAKNGLANTLAVQFFDNGKYSSNPHVLLTERTAEYGQWTQLSALLKELPADFDLTGINKIQLQSYWPGTYYFDDVRVSKPPKLVIDPQYLSSGTVKWGSFVGAAVYTLQQSTVGPDGPWTTLYSGTQTQYLTTRLNRAWFRVRWETKTDAQRNLVPYASDWSEAAQYDPKLVVLRKSGLEQNGQVDWSFIPQTAVYEIEEAVSRTGPWLRIHLGGRPVSPLPAKVNYWYRARAVKVSSAGLVTEFTPWGPVLTRDPSAYLVTAGMVIKEKSITGPTITLKGVNLGSSLLIEPWMMLGGGNVGAYRDDWTIRNTLTARFGTTTADQIMRDYQRTYLQEADFDILYNMGVNFVRLPVYYWNIRKLTDQGQWIGSSWDFQEIDRIINLCGDRGIYVLLDLHGAPGGQSREFHTGRENFNKLYDPANDTWRQRTVELWRAIAQRYKNNTVVAGYDLINESFGVFTPEYFPTPQDGFRAMTALYVRLYNVIRNSTAQGGADDNQHMIVMEGVPADNEWQQLPKPADYGWKNVAYQFHFYRFPQDQETPEQHLAASKAYMDIKVAEAQAYQAQYNVPLMVGEFNGHSQKAIWDYNLAKFRERGWSWAVWSYKGHDYYKWPFEGKYSYIGNWSLYEHAKYDEALPDFAKDSLEVIRRKLGKYDTLRYHTPNTSLIKILQSYFK